MIPDFTVVPANDRMRLTRATVPEALAAALPGPARGAGLRTVDIEIAGGTIEAIAAPGTLPPPSGSSLDLDDGLVLPCFADIHTHIDKGHIWPRRPNPDGTFLSALEAVRLDCGERWSAADVRRRMEFALRTAYAHGTRLLRTHIDSIAPQHTISWPVFSELRAAWSRRLELQAVALVPFDARMTAPAIADLSDYLCEMGGILGGVTLPGEEGRDVLRRSLEAAAERGLEVDLHVDETLDPAAEMLRAVAETAMEIGFSGRILCGHCCSLSTQDEARALDTLDLVARAGISIVSLPMCNLYLQDRGPDRTPRRRGVTLVHEMAARGIAVAVASDNTRDPFYAYGDLDMLEVFREATRILHFDHPIGAWPATIAHGAAAIAGRADIGRIAAGLPADLVLFRARDWSELLARPQSDRIVLRNGRPIDRRLPDYRDLDDLMESP